MSMEEREPFIEPFMQNEGDVEGCGSDVVSVKTHLDVSPSNTPMSIATNRVQKGWATVQLRVPLSTKQRLTTIAALERRQITTVVQMAVMTFISKGEREPRPYLPPTDEKSVRLTFRLSADTAGRISERAEAEGRCAVVLYTRALLDYIESSNLDPGLPTGTAAETDDAETETEDPETETAGNVPETEASE